METEDNVPHPAHIGEDSVSCVVSVRGLRENWQKWSDGHQQYQKHNPFSHDAKPAAVVLQRGHDGYGRPQEGSLTEQRGKDAHVHVSREVQELCEVIRDIGETRDRGENGAHGNMTTVEFGKLFEHYVTISNKVVGVLLRARKQGLVQFDGEMLWQGQDDQAVITLLQ